MKIYDINYYPTELQEVILSNAIEYTENALTPNEKNPYGQFFKLKSDSYINFFDILGAKGYEINNLIFVRFSYEGIFKYNASPDDWSEKDEYSYGHDYLYFNIFKNNKNWKLGVNLSNNSPNLERLLDYLKNGYDEELTNKFIENCKLKVKNKNWRLNYA